MKVYGPYKGKDGRWRTVIYKHGVGRRTMSYPRYVMEDHLGRALTSTEDIHHKDGNTDNNALDNLTVVKHDEHCRSHATKYLGRLIICAYCEQSVSITGPQERNYLANRRRGKAGPFCSRHCSGKYGTDIQNNRAPRQECLV